MKQLIYQSGSPLKEPGLLIKNFVADVVASRELAMRLFIRNISARYRQSLLGYFWAVFPPLATTIIWLVLTSQNVVSIEVEGISYAVFLITGTILWQSFTDGIQITIRVISESRAMLAKINFPREALPLAALAECVFGLLIRLVVLGVAYIFLDATLQGSAWLALAGMLAMIMFGLLLGVFLSPLALLYDDVSSGLLILLQIWFYCTPVIYAPAATGIVGALSLYNPVSPLLNQTRDWLLTGGTAHFPAFLIVVVSTFSALFVALLIYRIALPRAIERISS